MNIQNITGTLGKCALCLLIPGAMGLISGCQAPPPVREYRVEQRTSCSPCKPACVTSLHTVEVQRNVSMWPVAECPSSRPYLLSPRSYIATDQNYPNRTW